MDRRIVVWLARIRAPGWRYSLNFGCDSVRVIFLDLGLVVRPQTMPFRTKNSVLERLVGTKSHPSSNKRVHHHIDCNDISDFGYEKWFYFGMTWLVENPVIFILKNNAEAVSKQYLLQCPRRHGCYCGRHAAATS